MLQLIHGLTDKDIQENVLAVGAALEEGAEMSLVDVVNFVEKMEMGKTARALVSKVSGGLNRLSDHQRGNQSGRLEKRKDDKTSESGKCGFFGKDFFF